MGNSPPKNAEGEAAERARAEEEFSYLLTSGGDIGDGFDEEPDRRVALPRSKVQILPGRVGSSIGCHKVPPLMEESEWMESFRQGYERERDPLWSPRKEVRIWFEKTSTFKYRHVPFF